MPGKTGKPRMLDFVITYLEMTEKPRITPFVPTGMKLALLHAEPPLLSFYRYLYNTVGEPWLWWERRAMDDATLKAHVENEKVEIYVLYCNGVPAGYGELDRRQKPEIELAYFGLIPDFIGRGLGQYLLNTIVDIAWSYDPTRLIVNTCNWDHPKAVQTYQRAGFAPYDQKRRQVPDPRDKGIIPATLRHAND